MRKLPALLFLTGLLSLAWLSSPPAPPLRREGRPLLPRPGLLKTVFRAQLGLVTDYFWLLTLNRIGAATNADGYRDVYYYADLATDLDPRFQKVYLFGGITIPFHEGRGQYANTAESTQLLRKGLTHLPEDPRLRFQLAHNLIFFEKKYKEAAAIIEELSRQPDAPAWYSALATRLYAQAGDFDASMSLTLALRDSAEDEETHAYYDRRVREIYQEQELRKIDEAIARYRSREGRMPRDIPTLLASGDLATPPEDPLGGEFFFADDGRAYSTASKFRLEVIHDVRNDSNERILPKPLTTNHDANQP